MNARQDPGIDQRDECRIGGEFSRNQQRWGNRLYHTNNVQIAIKHDNTMDSTNFLRLPTNRDGGFIPKAILKTIEKMIDLIHQKPTYLQQTLHSSTCSMKRAIREDGST